MVMVSKDGIYLIVDREFEFFEEFSYAASVWGADFRQLKSEKIKSTMFQANPSER